MPHLVSHVQCAGPWTDQETFDTVFQQVAAGRGLKFAEYVKVCSLYGAGFYYIPGTDICMKVGGYVRYQVDYGAGNNISGGPFNGTGGFNSRVSNVDVSQRTRAVATFDTRQQTAYGTLRTYLLMGFQQDSTVAPSTAPAVYMTRGFIQIAGFTFGKATSFFDFFAAAAVSYNAGFISSPDTGDAGAMVGAYTAQFGNGVSATVAIEQSRRNSTTYVPGVALGPYTLGAVPTNNNLGGVAGVGSFPDIVGNLRIDQAWGSAQVSAAAHDVSASYYGAAPLTTNGHPDNKWGWAVSGGLRLNAPMIGPGDYFQGAVVYSQGATRYASVTPGGANNLFFDGNQFAFGLYDDANFGGTAAGPGAFGNQINLTTAWSVAASYEHFWTPSLRTSVYGSYIDVSRNSDGNAAACAGFGFNAAAIQCNMDFSVWNIGSRSQWNVTKDLYVGLDVIYQKLNSSSLNNGNGVNLLAPGGGRPAATYFTRDQDAVTATWRVHRDIVP